MRESMRKILIAAQRLGATDIHITAGTKPVFRINGMLKKYGKERLTPEVTEEMAKSFFSEEAWKEFKQNKEIDLIYELPGVSRFRINVYFQRSSAALAIRVIPNRIPTIDELNLPPVIKEIANSKQGLILVTGPSGSGKTTTMAAMIDYMNRTMNKHIITLEDPIEYLHDNNKSIIEQREIGLDTKSFACGLRLALR